MEAGARGIKNVTLELGGKSPLIIFNDARPGFTSKSSGSGSLNPYTELRIGIVLFSPVAFKIPTKNKFFLSLFADYLPTLCRYI
jgi:hypothetical protein